MCLWISSTWNFVRNADTWAFPRPPESGNPGNRAKKCKCLDIPGVWGGVQSRTQRTAANLFSEGMLEVGDVRPVSNKTKSISVAVSRREDEHFYCFVESGYQRASWCRSSVRTQKEMSWQRVMCLELLAACRHIVHGLKYQ